MESLFFVFLFLSLYSYSVYPGLLCLVSKCFGKPWCKAEVPLRVTVLISVYNEQEVIEEKLKNALSLCYPKDQTEIIVVSDGATDRTNDIAASFSDSGIILKSFPGRSGKTACLNRVVPESTGDVILFTDANSMFPPDLLSNVTRNFFDENVGLVTGWTKYMTRDGAEETTGVYSRLEMLTKRWESLISSCVGADGAIFAMRRRLYTALEDRDINDFVLPLKVVSQGKRVILDREIYCFENSSKDGKAELRRQARMTNRTLGAIRRNLVLLNPAQFGSFSFFLFSHKVMRFLAPFFVAGTFVTNIFLLGVSVFYVVLFLIEIFCLLLGLAGMAGHVRGKPADICKTFLITFYAQLIGWTRAIRGVPDTIWTPQR